MTSEQARSVRKKGHDDAKEFARLIGLPSDYQNDPQAKKDVVDLAGDAHSVKSGTKKWQIFLYAHSRFEKDKIFKRLNGLGQLMMNCLDVFPDNYDEYISDKPKYKNLLKEPMQKLKERLTNKDTLEAFFDKSFFNAGEVKYLTIKMDDGFHIFHCDDVVKVLAENITVENSKARHKKQFDNQKVVFKYNGKTIGEIEIRRDSKVHYKEMKFWMRKDKTFFLLKDKIPKIKKLKSKLYAHGKAIKTFTKF